MQKGWNSLRIIALLPALLIFSAVLPISPASAAACAPTTSTFTGDGTTGTNGVGYTLIEFKTTGTCDWTVPKNLNVDVLIVGGGGGAGFGSNGGGGGAGQVVTNNSTLSLLSGAVVSITVGSGGSGGWAASSASWNFGGNGTASSFGAYATASGGGGGGGNNGSSGRNGGSGGGGSGTVANAESLNGGSGSTSANSGWTARGNNGGNGAGNYGAGGGGAAAAGATSSGSAGAGGNGLTIFGKSVGGGGGGWGNSNTSANAFGGGNGVLTNYNVSNACSPSCQGTANTGGGGGGGGAGGSGLVAVRYITDSTPPVITGPSSSTGSTSSISIPENSTTVFTFTANESVTWSDSGTDASFFTISSGGALTITSRNFEAPADVGSDNTYVVIITATDLAGNATTQTLTVTITDVNEAPVITNNGSAATYSLSQAENISSIATYAATDVDTATTLTWSLSGTDAGDFSIVSNSGVLTFTANPDFEAPADSDANNVYVFVVTVSDGALIDTQTVTITITNVVEDSVVGAPTIVGTAYKGITTTITVTTNTAGKVRFFVGGKRITNCLSRATTGTYPNFTATCSWKPALQNRTILTASLSPTDTNFRASDSPPSTILVLKRTTSR